MSLALLTIYGLRELFSQKETSTQAVPQRKKKFPLFLRASICLREKLYNLMNCRKQSAYQKAVDKYRSERAKQIEAFQEKYRNFVKPEVQTKIINASLAELAKMIRDQEVTSEEIVVTFCLRSAEIGTKYGYVASIIFEEAVEEAKKKDEQVKNLKPGEELPPFHGIPISVKELIKIKGVKHFLGYAARLDISSNDEDSAYVSVIRKLGGIPFVTTNVPQGLWGVVTQNNLWGLAKNPWNLERVSGGSSGGEGGLIASRCSPVGIGTDAVGSVRIPAAWSGLASFRATSKRASKIGRFGASGSDIDIFREVEAVLGPMCKSVDDVIYFMKGIYGHFGEFDLFSINYKFDENLYQEGLKTSGLNIAYLLESPKYQVHPAIKDAIETTVKALAEQGHNVFEVNIGEDFEELCHAVMTAVFAVGPDAILNVNIKGERPMPEAYIRHLTGAFPNFVTKWYTKLLRSCGEMRLAEQFEWYYRKNLLEFNRLVVKKEILKKKLVKLWQEKKIDAIIMPPMPFLAIKNDGTELIWNQLHYMAPSACYDIPAGVVTVTRAKPEHEKLELKYNDIIDDVLQYQTQGTAGLPVAIQVMGMAYQDEKILGIMKQIDNIWKFNDKPELASI